MEADTEPDAFAAFDFAEFTEADFAQIDAHIEQHFSSVRPQESFEFDAPNLPNLIELTEGDFLEIDSATEAEQGPPVKSRQKRRVNPHKSSLVQRFRPKRLFSVSDLVGPAWCEVQFDYGLHQKRSRPIKQRPTSFVSSSGKEISVEKKVAEKNDTRTKQGTAVHKELEREVRLEVLKVSIDSEEERWGLRLLNLIASFRVLENADFTREVPVFGIVNGEIVVGIVDEISKSPKKRVPDSPKRKESTKRMRRSPSPGQKNLEAYLQTSPPSTVPPQLPEEPVRVLKEPGKRPESPTDRFLLRILDTKTRVNDSLPPKEDTYPSRLQVMLYYRLLSALVATETPFDFSSLWKAARVDPLKDFSTTFLVQAGLLLHNDGFPTTSLDDLAESWRRVVGSSGVAGVEPTLKLVYRLQPKGFKSKGKGRAKESHLRAMQRRNDSDKDLAKAIAASLADFGGRPADLDAMEGSSIPQNGSANESSPRNDNSLGEEDVDVELQRALYQSLAPEIGGPSQAAVDDEHSGDVDSPAPPVQDEKQEDDGIHSFKIIGTTKFKYDPLVLQKHLDSIFDLWHGRRKPEGVPVDLARRCNSCEYRNDCEWRETEALKFSKISSVETTRASTSELEF